jgi:uncharacterized membrane protein YphA (DoxX/SURF4 family)
MLILHFILAIIFIDYGCVKLLNTSSFASTIRSYQIIPQDASLIIARTLPPFEIGLGVLLLFNIATTIIAVVLTTLLLSFNIILIKVWRNHNISECGCGGSKPTSPYKALVRNTILILIASITIISSSLTKLYTSWFLTIIEIAILVGIVFYVSSSQSNWANKFTHQLRHHSIPRFIDTTNTTSKKLSSRRSFIRGVSIITLGMLAVAGFGTGNTALARCNCNYSSVCDVVRYVNCGCCNTGQCNGSSCLGFYQQWKVYCCYDGSGQCDVSFEGTFTITCLCS